MGESQIGYFLTLQKIQRGQGGTKSVIWSDPPCKDGNARFTTVPLKLGFPCAITFYSISGNKLPLIIISNLF